MTVGDTGYREVIELIDGVLARLKIGWIKGELALNKDGLICHPESEEACCWCLVGALIAVNGLVHSPNANDLLDRMRKITGYRELTAFNDNAASLEVIEAKLLLLREQYEQMLQ